MIKMAIETTLKEVEKETQKMKQITKDWGRK